MNLAFNYSLASEYHSGSQIARVLTETWVTDNMFCPRCGYTHIKHFENNRPVADFYCPSCYAEYELKSKKGTIEHKVNDGAYETMIERIISNNNPDFFFMNYCGKSLTVKDFIVVPKYFFVPDIIEKREPLADTARRAGWVGCNILLDKIPMQGRISIIKNGFCQDISSVVTKLNKTKALITNDIQSRGWLFDILNCVNKIKKAEFCLNDLYKFEDVLFQKHPENHNIQAKIRQQLQILRDKNIIIFLGKGRYKKHD